MYVHVPDILPETAVPRRPEDQDHSIFSNYTCRGSKLILPWVNKATSDLCSTSPNELGSLSCIAHVTL